MTPPRILDTVSALYCDLDGVVYRGTDPIPGAADALTAAAETGTRVAYLTNNASRTPAAVCAQLQAMGLPAQESDIVTSAQACVSQLRVSGVPADAPLCVVGGQGLRTALAEAGYRPAESGQSPVAVVQGFSREVGWKDLAEAAYALQGGARWFVTNDDHTLPQERGLAPGNGTLVAAVAATTDVRPVIAGKPHLPIYSTAAERFDTPAALGIGDRLDTDIAGANAAGLPSALVLSGVDGPEQLYAAPPELRPRFVLHTLHDLFAPVQNPVVEGTSARCGAAQVHLSGSEILLDASGAAGDRVLATASLIWALALDPQTLRVNAACTTSL